MDLGLRGKVALVCGGSRGIGFAAAEELARDGAHVTICARDAGSLADADNRLSKAGAGVRTIAADLSTAEGIGAVIAAMQKTHDRLDVLITNSGGPPTSSALGPDWSTWQRASELLLRSAVELTRAFVPGMQARKWGRVIGITSLAVKQPVPSLVLSNSLRAAVTGFYRTLADEVAADGVTVNTVLPGYTETERLIGLAESITRRTGESRETVYDQWRATTPAGRLGRPEEVGAVIAFLASNRAGFVTGQAVCVDGGAVRTLL
ncbi:MAG: SDR family oxidoreductase [Gemmatimonadales bacterium]